MILLAATAGCLLACPLRGQTVRGRIVEAVTEDGIAGATVRLLDAQGVSVAATIAGPSGAFVLNAPRPAGYTVDAEHIGYARVSHGPVQLGEAEETVVLLRLTMAVIPLTPIDVEVEARVRKLERVGFYDRQRLGLGTFIERHMIGENARSASDVLRRVAGLRLVIQGYFTDVQTRGTSGMTICRPAIYLDGTMASGPRRSATSFNLEDLPASDIEAIEVYPGSASVPPQYNGGNSACGIILFWTMKPGR